MIKSFMIASQPNYASNRPLRLFAHRRSPLAFAPVTPFFATDTVDPQLTENPATLSPVLATLTRRVKPYPFVCHSYKKHPGGGGTPSDFLSLLLFNPICDLCALRARRLPRQDRGVGIRIQNQHRPAARAEAFTSRTLFTLFRK